MKKTLFCLMCVLLCMTISISATAKTFTLPERMAEQLAWGSGLKGIINANFDGDGEIARLFSGLNGRKISIRGITDKNQQSLYYAYEADPADEEHLMGLTQVYRNEQEIYLKSELLGDTVYDLIALKDRTAEGIDATPSILPIIVQLMVSGGENTKNEWNVILDEYGIQIETWLSDFAGMPEVKKLDDGESIMTFSYTIPGDAIIDEICNVAGTLLGNSDVTEPLLTVLTEQQSDVYLNSGLLEYYREALKSVVSTEPVKMIREVTTKGEELRAEISLPLPEGNATGFTAVTMYTQNDMPIYRFTGEKEELGFGFRELKNAEDEASYEGVLSRKSADPEKKNFAISWKADMKRQAEEDTEGNKTDDIVWKISTAYAPDMIPENNETGLYDKNFAVELNIGLNYSGKNANTSPTTLKISIEGKIGEAAVNVNSTFKSSNSWVIIPFETGKAVPFGKYLNENKGNALEALIKTLCGTSASESK